MEHQLSGLCEIRWIEQHDGIKFFSKIVESLDYILSRKDIQKAAEVRTLKWSTL